MNKLNPYIVLFLILLLAFQLFMLLVNFQDFLVLGIYILIPLAFLTSGFWGGIVWEIYDRDAAIRFHKGYEENSIAPWKKNVDIDEAAKKSVKYTFKVARFYVILFIAGYVGWFIYKLIQYCNQAKFFPLSYTAISGVSILILMSVLLVVFNKALKQKMFVNEHIIKYGFIFQNMVISLLLILL